MIDKDELLVCMCLMDRKPTDNIYFTQDGIILCDTCYRIYKDLPLSMMKGDTALRMCSVYCRRLNDPVCRLYGVFVSISIFHGTLCC